MQQPICNNKTAPSKTDGERAKSDSHQADGELLMHRCTSPLGCINECINQLRKPPGASAPTSKQSLRDDPKVLTLTIQVLPRGKGWPPFSLRLRGLLKVMLRSFGFKCTGINWHNPESKTP